MSRVCVFCGSTLGKRPRYQEAALAFADALLAGGHGLVYGGAQVGLMGVLANRVLAGGGRVVGVIPRQLFHHEVVHRGLSELHEVDDMMARKRLMMELADCFVALPGAYGTADELFEALTWRQLGSHDKPCGLLNVDGCFNHLLAWLDRIDSDGLLRPGHRALLRVDGDPGRLLAALTGPGAGS